jgi:hypothetical protein
MFPETQAATKARREDGNTTSTMMRTATTSNAVLVAPIAAIGAMTTPGAPKRKLSTQTVTVAHKLHGFIIHNPTAATRPTVPSTIPE